MEVTAAVEKYDPDQPRDDRGRFGSKGGEAGGAPRIRSVAGALAALKALPRTASITRRTADLTGHRSHAEALGAVMSADTRGTLYSWMQSDHLAIGALARGEALPAGYDPRSVARNLRELRGAVEFAEALAQRQGLPPRQLYRGFPTDNLKVLERALSVGKKIDLHGPTSWSVSPRIATAFSNPGGGKFSVVYEVKTTHGLSIPTAIKPQYSHQVESVLMDRTYRVTKTAVFRSKSADVLLVSLDGDDTMTKSDWDESKHPRGPDGRFGSTGPAYSAAVNLLVDAPELTVLEAIEAVQNSGGEIFDSDTRQMVPAKEVVDELRQLIPAPLPKADLKVYHATDAQTAEQFLRRGFIPATKPHARSADYEYAPGRGIEPGLYVAHSDTAVESYGRVILEIDIPKEILKVPRELAQHGETDPERALNNHDGAVILRALPPSAFRKVTRKANFDMSECLANPSAMAKADATDIATLALSESGEDTYVIDRDFWQPDDDVCATLDGIDGAWFMEVPAITDLAAIAKRARTVLTSPLAPGAVFATSEPVTASDHVDILSEAVTDGATEAEQAIVAKALSHVRIAKTSEERFVLGIVLEPDTVDSQGDFYSEEDVRKAAHSYMEHHTQLGLQHREIVTGKLKILESFIAPATFQIDDQTVQKGTWLMGIRVIDDGLWVKTKKGDFTGFSIGGSAFRRRESYVAKGDFDESKYQRDDHGRFAGTGAGGGRASAQSGKGPSVLAQRKAKAALLREKRLAGAKTAPSKPEAARPPVAPAPAPARAIPSPAPARPLAEMLPKDIDASKRLLHAGAQRMDDDGGKMVRTQMRKLLEGMGMSAAAEYESLLTGAGTMRSEKINDDVRGLHHWNGAITVQPDVATGAKAAFKAMAEGKEVSAKASNALQVLIHEELHGYGPSRPDNYHGLGAVIEEVTTEVLARAVTSEMTSRPVDKYKGAYTHWITGVLNAVQSASKAPTHVEAWRHVEHAAVSYKRLGAMGNTPLDEAFVRQLPIPIEQQDDALQRIRSSTVLLKKAGV